MYKENYSINDSCDTVQRPVKKSTVFQSLIDNFDNKLTRLDALTINVIDKLQAFSPYDEPKEKCDPSLCKELSNSYADLLSYKISKLNDVIERLEFCSRHLDVLV